MRRFYLTVCLLALCAMLTACPQVRGESILFESGTLGETGLVQGTVAGTNVSPSVYTGVRFEVTEPVLTSQVGGHFVSATGGTFFGAIVALDDENDFPDSGDLMSDDVLGATELAFPTLSDEAFSNLTLRLEPGWYGLVFGSGLFGTAGDGAALRNNIDIGVPTYIGGQPSGPGVWSDITAVFTDHRFVVRGEMVPEPTASTLLIAGCVCAWLRGVIRFFCVSCVKIAADSLLKFRVVTWRFPMFSSFLSWRNRDTKRRTEFSRAVSGTNLKFEQLERRRVLATYVVNIDYDAIAPFNFGDEDVTLREAITLAN